MRNPRTSKWVAICGIFFVLSAKSGLGRDLRSSSLLSPKVAGELKAKDTELTEKLEELQAQVDVLQEQYRLLVQKTSLGFLNQFYLRAGLSLISPRLRGSGITADSGVGGFVGAGQYFGRNHVIDLGFEWDIYPSISLRYRFEFHNENPSITIGPVVGLKLRAVQSGPIDNSIDKPQLLKETFALAGVLVGFPLGHTLFTLELLYLFPKQSFLIANLGAHFFLF